MNRSTPQQPVVVSSLATTPQEVLAHSSGELSLSQARKILGNAFRPRAAIYWTDLLLTWFVGVGAFRLVREAGLSWPVRGALFVVSCGMIYRAGLFIHELVHLPQQKFTTFRVVWNLLCGIPFLIPSFVYYTHVDHHRRRHYGTDQDGEYLPLAHRSPWWLVGYLAQSWIIPLLAVIRFGVLTPLTWLHPKVRIWVHRHASSMIIDPTYLRPLPTERILRIIRWQELGCFAFIVGFATLLLVGRLPWFVLGQAYLTGVTVVTVNALRTLAAHRWLGQGETMSFQEQLVDSVNYPASHWWSALWAPVGLRFHALHHLFPSLPYHALATAHRQLMTGLPANSPYQLTESPSLLYELCQLWRRSRQATRRVATTANTAVADVTAAA